MSIGFSIENGDLIVKETHSGHIIWQGKPLDSSVENLLEHPDNRLCFILLSKEDSPKLYPGGPLKAFNNLLCINFQGKTLWIADLPSSGVDYYTKVIWSKDLRTRLFKVDLGLKDNTLVAFSYSGFLVNIHPTTGEIINKLLIK